MPNDSTADHNRLVQLLKDRSISIGDFTLSSGRRSLYYVDARTTTMSAAGLELVGRLGLQEIHAAGWEATAVGGLTLGADPVSYAIALASRHSTTPLDGFTVRKDAKKHGTGKRIEGCFSAGAHVVVVEDVITTGGSALNAIQAVEAEGGTVTGVLAVVDRGEGGREAIERGGCEVRALVRLGELEL
jgi:orotate phosphoribosyltransferase